MFSVGGSTYCILVVPVRVKRLHSRGIQHKGARYKVWCVIWVCKFRGSAGGRNASIIGGSGSTAFWTGSGSDQRGKTGSGSKSRSVFISQLSDLIKYTSQFVPHPLEHFYTLSFTYYIILSTIFLNRQFLKIRSDPENWSGS
jgi:hypothetical protein